MGRTHEFDVIVIGAGPAGDHCAGRLADAGLRVAIVERGLVGGRVRLLGLSVRRLRATVALVEGMDHLLPREAKPLGDTLGTALAGDGIELRLGEHASRVGRDGDEYVVEFAGGDDLRADRLLVATGRRARADGIGLDTVGVEPTRQGVPVDERMRVTDGVRAIGDATGVWPLTYMGKYQGRVAADNILGRDRTANYDAVPRVVFTDPQAAAVGESEGALSATVPPSEVPRTSTYTREYAERPGFMTLLSSRPRP